MAQRTIVRTALLAQALLLAGTANAQTPPASPENPVPPAPPAAPEVVSETIEVHIRTDREAAEEYARALEAAEAEQRAALEAVEAARRELTLRAEKDRRAAEEARQLAEERRGQARELSEAQREAQRQVEEAKRQEREELRVIQRELEKAHENLRRASREVARVHRDIYRSERMVVPAPSLGGNRAVIGVILGDNTPDGVQVIGLSPDGPAERAGLQQGDVIVSLMGEPLVVDGSDGRRILTETMQSVEPGDELVVLVQRDGELIETEIVTEDRTPLGWQTVTRIMAPDAPMPPGAPGAPNAPVVVQSFEVPNFDRERLEKELEAMREELEERRIIIGSRQGDAPGELFYEFEALSEVGDAAIAGTNIWFGLPLTRGLEFAEIDTGLGEYFDVDGGVLVLRANADNALGLRSGDVIQSGNDTAVQRPGDVIRALRNVEPGAALELDIKRSRQSETLTVELTEDLFGQHFHLGEFGFGSIEWNGDSDSDGWRFELHTDP